MCSHYQSVVDDKRLLKQFGAQAPAELKKSDIWPGYQAAFIRLHPHAGVGDAAVPHLDCQAGIFGLLPHWAKDIKSARHTFNARSETAAQKPSFRDAWHHGQRCIIPAEAIYEPDWRSGKAIATRITRTDGEPMGIAGLWSSWAPPAGPVVLSFTMLTINANGHPLMQQFHKPGDEKRMVVVLPPSSYQDWLHAKANDAGAFLNAFSAEAYSAKADQTPTR